MKPLSKKRAASEYYSSRPQKHPRTALQRPDGQNSSPSQHEGLLARWSTSLTALYSVSRDTAFCLFGRNSNDMATRKMNEDARDLPDASATTSDTTLVERSASCRPGSPQPRGKPYDFVEPHTPTRQANRSHPTLSHTLRTRLDSTHSTSTGLSRPRILNSSDTSHSVQSISPFSSPSSQLTRPVEQLKLGTFQNFAPLSDPSQRDTPMRKPPRRRKGSMGPPPVPHLRNTEPFPSSMDSTPHPASTSDSFRVLSRSLSVHSIRTPRVEKREHILASQHKAKVAADLEIDRQTMIKELYAMHRRQGYRSNLHEFEGYLEYRALLEAADSPKEPSRGRQLALSSSLVDIRSLNPIQPTRLRRHSDKHQTPEYLRRALDMARATLDGPKPAPPFTPTFEQRQLKDRAKDEEIERRLRPKKKPLPPALPEEDELSVKAFLKTRGVISKYEREQVSDTDMQRLRPGEWLNDEIINFYGAMLLGRSEKDKENNGGRFLNVHYFSTFFWAKLEKDGYEKARLAKWTKKFDLFQKDIVLIPINHNNVHWSGAAINFKQKRIESYDSMSLSRPNVYKRLRQYLDAEHRNKKKKPFNFDGWKDYTLEDTPQQENHYDCGVFTCQFLQALSRGEENFNFTQKDIPYLRRRMIWEIGHARLRDDT